MQSQKKPWFLWVILTLLGMIVFHQLGCASTLRDSLRRIESDHWSERYLGDHPLNRSVVLRIDESTVHDFGCPPYDEKSWKTLNNQIMAAGIEKVAFFGRERAWHQSLNNPASLEVYFLQAGETIQDYIQRLSNLELGQKTHATKSIEQDLSLAESILDMRERGLADLYESLEIPGLALSMLNSGITTQQSFKNFNEPPLFIVTSESMACFTGHGSPMEDHLTQWLKLKHLHKLTLPDLIHGTLLYFLLMSIAGMALFVFPLHTLWKESFYFITLLASFFIVSEILYRLQSNYLPILSGALTWVTFRGLRQLFVMTWQRRLFIAFVKRTRPYLEEWQRGRAQWKERSFEDKHREILEFLSTLSEPIHSHVFQTNEESILTLDQWHHPDSEFASENYELQNQLLKMTREGRRKLKFNRERHLRSYLYELSLPSSTIKTYWHIECSGTPNHQRSEEDEDKLLGNVLNMMMWLSDTETHASASPPKSFRGTNQFKDIFANPLEMNLMTHLLDQIEREHTILGEFDLACALVSLRGVVGFTNPAFDALLKDENINRDGTIDKVLIAMGGTWVERILRRAWAGRRVQFEILTPKGTSLDIRIQPICLNVARNRIRKGSATSFLMTLRQVSRIDQSRRDRARNATYIVPKLRNLLSIMKMSGDMLGMNIRASAKGEETKALRSIQDVLTRKSSVMASRLDQLEAISSSLIEGHDEIRERVFVDIQDLVKDSFLDFQSRKERDLNLKLNLEESQLVSPVLCAPRILRDLLVEVFRSLVFHHGDNEICVGIGEELGTVHLQIETRVADGVVSDLQREIGTQREDLKELVEAFSEFEIDVEIINEGHRRLFDARFPVLREFQE